MLLITIRILYALICIGAIATFVTTAGLPAIFQGREVLVFFGMLLVSQIVTVIDIFIPRKRVEVISSTYFGLLIGVLLSYLLILAMEPVIKDSPMRGPLVMLTTLILPYLCISMLMQTKDDFRFIIPYIEFSRELKGGRPLILDSSALIDGRIAEVVDTNILDAQMIVPEFVLLEVQDIADSHDRMRRNRGRRGLDVLNKLQNNPDVDVKVYETKDRSYQGVPVDQRLVLLAKELGGRVVTNDFNLNKVAKVQGVDVINLNDVANSLKPRYLPGEHLRIKVIKEGESQGQGVGYLDDGTMVVCEQASSLIGEETDIIVTSVLQSSAGRMIFGRLGNVPARS